MKYCKTCGKPIIKNYHTSKSQYESRIYCSRECVYNDLEHYKTHGFCTTNYVHPLYDAWRNMKRRCFYVNSPYYHNYGGRGVTVCSNWKNDFISFASWALSNGWEQGLTLDRINTNGNYEPLNCRWITSKDQLRNRRISLNITYNGRTKNAKDWAVELGISYTAFLKRLRKWDDIKRVFEEPVHTSQQRF